ncbi:hypothetical protein T12_6911 [Trichinella patagoniensis]|uniref:Uncharacterized protein n=1 Tax=Trichinella patagoniensis TaxID=990121 RepID=A0A0V0ZBI2_9BILA|nr:hypothetical protein T12_6911 [Trichinella patagoniensis]
MEEEEETGEACLQSFKYCKQTSVYPLFTLLHQSHCHVSIEPLVVKSIIIVVEVEGNINTCAK